MNDMRLMDDEIAAAALSAELDLSPARPATTVAEMTNSEVREWAEQNRRKPAAHKLGPARLEVVRVLREQAYSALQLVGVPVLTEQVAAAEAVLDTPVDQLAAMVSMTDTVLGNWRTIAATVIS